MNPDDLAPGVLCRHKKTGHTYQVVTFATIEADLTPAIVYAESVTGRRSCWVRPLAEFCDGRFELVDMASLGREG